MPFLQYADKRDLREKIFKAYTNRGNNNNENDNKEVVKQLGCRSSGESPIDGI